MSKKRRSGNVSMETPIDMTPMIDIVFQLLIFFVLTMKFIEQEGELRSFLPKNRGINPTTPSAPDLSNVTIYLDWKGDPETGSCIAITTNYQPEEGGNQRQYQFGTVEPGTAGYAANKVSVVDYPYPDFNHIRQYLEYRKRNYPAIGGTSLPVTVNFTDAVPVQMIVNMIDICIGLEITDFALNAQGVE